MHYEDAKQKERTANAKSYLHENPIFFGRQFDRKKIYDGVVLEHGVRHCWSIESFFAIAGFLVVTTSPPHMTRHCRTWISHAAVAQPKLVLVWGR